MMAAISLPSLPRLAFSTATPKFASNDSDEISGYHCFVHAETDLMPTSADAYAQAESMVARYAAVDSLAGAIRDLISPFDGFDGAQLERRADPATIMAVKQARAALSMLEPPIRNTL